MDSRYTVLYLINLPYVFFIKSSRNIILSVIVLIAIVLLCCACGSKQAPAPAATSAPETSNEPAPTNTPPFQMMNWSPTQQAADPIKSGSGAEEAQP